MMQILLGEESLLNSALLDAVDEPVAVCLDRMNNVNIKDVVKGYKLIKCSGHIDDQKRKEFYERHMNGKNIQRMSCRFDNLKNRYFHSKLEVILDKTKQISATITMS
jgi:enoyl reductase-like protein